MGPNGQPLVQEIEALLFNNSARIAHA